MGAAPVQSLVCMDDGFGLFRDLRYVGMRLLLTHNGEHIIQKHIYINDDVRGKQIITG